MEDTTNNDRQCTEFLEKLQAHIRVAGGNATIEYLAKKPLGEVFDLIYPNGITLSPYFYRMPNESRYIPPLP